MMIFYAPVYMEGKPAGVFLGMYFAEDYLRDMLTVSYFGEKADVYLCTQEGKVIASSNGKIYEEDILDSLTKEGVIDAGTAEAARVVFTEGGEVALLCEKGCQTDNICVVDLPGHQYVLVQAFPKDVTQKMETKANMAGIMLELGLLGLFVIYIAFLVVNGGKKRKKLEEENTFINDVLRGVNILFSSRYLVANLDENDYSYLTGADSFNTNIPMKGVYSELMKLHEMDVIGEEGKKAFSHFTQIDTLRENLKTEDFVIHECHVSRKGKEEWEHLIIMCLERRRWR